MSIISILLFSLTSIPWIILLMTAIHYLRNIKKYGIKNFGVVSSILYLGLSPVVYYDYIVYSKMSGGLDLIMGNNSFSILYRFLLFVSVLNLFVDFGERVFKSLKKRKEGFELKE